MDAHLRDLRYFVAVAEELHFGRAAERRVPPVLQNPERSTARRMAVQQALPTSGVSFQIGYRVGSVTYCRPQGIVQRTAPFPSCSTR